MTIVNWNGKLRPTIPVPEKRIGHQPVGERQMCGWHVWSYGKVEASGTREETQQKEIVEGWRQHGVEVLACPQTTLQLYKGLMKVYTNQTGV
jgi:hypothetical protein